MKVFSMFSVIRSWLNTLTQRRAAEPAISRDMIGSSDEGETVIHVHEDDWGMRNIYPMAVQSEVAADLGKAAATAAASKSPHGIGWTELHMIQEPSTDYLAAGLELAAVAAAVAPFLPRVRRFYATVFSAMRSADRDPWGSYEDDAWCFGFGPHCYIKVDEEGELVKAIWFDISSNAPADVAALRSAMIAINALVPSFIADYFMEAQIPIDNTDMLDLYFAERSKQVKGFNEWLKEQRNK